MKLLDGKKLSLEIKEKLVEKVRNIPDNICLTIIQVGDNSNSEIYIKNKIKFGNDIGIKTILKKYNSDISESDLISEIDILNSDDSIHGIIVQLPLPKNINKVNILNSIHHQKDVDGLSEKNLTKLFRGEGFDVGFIPATPKGVFKLLNENDIPVEGKNCVIVGRSVLVGKSLAMYLLNQDATVTVCHSKTENLPEITKKADILISAVGRDSFITDKHVSEGQILIDVGINSDGNKTVGDVNLQNPSILQAVSPVPGGVGPMTVASLFENVLLAYEMQALSK